MRSKKLPGSHVNDYDKGSVNILNWKAEDLAVEILKGRDHVEVLGVDGRIILEWILGK
jgi:hypothetical protein